MSFQTASPPLFHRLCTLSFRDEEAGVRKEGREEEMEQEMEEGQPEVEEEVPRINVEIPRCVAHLGSELYFVKLPNFLSVETR